MSQLNARDTAAPKGEKQPLPAGTSILMHAALWVLTMDLWGTVALFLLGHDPAIGLLCICVVAIVIYLLAGFDARKTWAWSSIILVFTMRAVAFFVPLLVIVASDWIRQLTSPAHQRWLDVSVALIIMGVPASFIALYGGTAAALFRSRTVFGVDARRGWTVLARRGWPLCIVFGGLSAAQLMRLMHFWRSLE